MGGFWLVESELDAGFLGHLVGGPGGIESEVDFDILYLIELHDPILDFFLDLAKEWTADGGQGHGDDAGTIRGNSNAINESEVDDGHSQFRIQYLCKLVPYRYFNFFCGLVFHNWKELRILNVGLFV